MVSLVMAWIEIGTVCRFSERRCAVTMISCRPCTALSSAAAATPCPAVPARTIATAAVSFPLDVMCSSPDDLCNRNHSARRADACRRGAGQARASLLP
jgi:hypothetical protein